MIHFEIRFKTQTVGQQKGKTVYYAHPKTQQHMSNKAVVDHIVRETSLTAGDVSNALISLSNVVCEALRQGMSVDLADLGSLRLSVSSKMVESADKVTVNGALKTPKILFTPKAPMREAANSVELSIDHTRVMPAKSKPTGGDSTPGGNTPGGGNEGGGNEGGGNTGGGGEVLE